MAFNHSTEYAIEISLSEGGGSDQLSVKIFNAPLPSDRSHGRLNYSEKKYLEGSWPDSLFFKLLACLSFCEINFGADPLFCRDERKRNDRIHHQWRIDPTDH